MPVSCVPPLLLPPCLSPERRLVGASVKLGCSLSWLPEENIGRLQPRTSSRAISLFCGISSDTLERNMTILATPLLFSLSMSSPRGEMFMRFSTLRRELLTFKLGKEPSGRGDSHDLKMFKTPSSRNCSFMCFMSRTFSTSWRSFNLCTAGFPSFTASLSLSNAASMRERILRQMCCLSAGFKSLNLLLLALDLSLSSISSRASSA
mmetsp:Transcript_11637/g.29630  ORF Transcript_11637/g.29630 Transcript_11637/m.29630 type:complete len:206 (+) Transcript_11637:1673-2290(+)